MTAPSTVSTRDLDGMSPSLSHPGNGLVEALVGKLNRSVRVSATPGAEAANVIEVACQLVDAKGKALAGARQVKVRTLAVTPGQGDLAAAAAPIGTLRVANNPATGENVAWFTTTDAGLFSFAVTDTAAEVCLVELLPEDGEPSLLVLTFA